MTAEELLVDLTRRGVQLKVDGAKLKVRAPEGVLTDGLRAALAARKADVIGMLRLASECCTVAVLQQGISEQHSDHLVPEDSSLPVVVNAELDPRADPRPDLVGDHARWTVLLRVAHDYDGPDPNGLFGALFGMRCCGARISSAPAPLDLTPEGPSLRWRLERGEIGREDWVRLRNEWLVPHTAALKRMLVGP